MLLSCCVHRTQLRRHTCAYRQYIMLSQHICIHRPRPLYVIVKLHIHSEVSVGIFCSQWHFILISLVCMSDSGDDVAASPVRSVYKGTAADVAKAVSPFVDKPCWLKYGEVMGKCRVEPGKLLPHVRLLASLHRLQTNLSFPRGSPPRQ